jgi:alpha,alpha-trehalose phosphorylase
MIDIADLNHNTKDGLHIASLAGAWSAVVNGFGGLRDYEGRLSLSPRLPPALTRMSFKLAYRDRRLQVEVRDSQATYTITEGEALEITHHGDRVRVGADEPLTLKVPPLPHRPEPTQPPGREPMRRRFLPT